MNSVVNQLRPWNQDTSVGIVTCYKLGSLGLIPSPVGSGGWPLASILCCGACLIKHRDNFTWTGCPLGILQPWFRGRLVMVKLLGWVLHSGPWSQKFSFRLSWRWLICLCYINLKLFFFPPPHKIRLIGVQLLCAYLKMWYVPWT
jgi:hypothetical protein